MPVLTRQRVRTRPVKYGHMLYVVLTLTQLESYFATIQKKKTSGNKDPCIDLENSNICFLFLQQRGVVHGEKGTYRRLGSPYDVLCTSCNANAC